MFTFAILLLIATLTLAQPGHNEVAHKLFGLMDADDDGEVTQRENEAYILSYDADKNTEVSKAEFSTALDKVDPALVGHEDALFTFLDHDADGHIDKNDIDVAFTKADSNRDGHIDHHEFHVTFQAIISHVG